MADATHYVEAPRRSPRRGGIRAVAEFRAADNRLGLGGIVEFTSPGCGIAVGDVTLCYPSGTDPQAEKTRSGIDTLEGVGVVFGAYAGVECWLDGSDYLTDARNLLEQGADRAVEAALNTWIQAATPGDAQASLDEAIATADSAADGAYPALPVIVMNRADAALAYASGALDGDGSGMLWTGNGTPVLSSSAITAGKVAVTGALTVLEGSVEAHQVQNYELNTEYAIAEQVFAILVDCEYLATWEFTYTGGGGGVGPAGASAYEIAVENGFVGTEVEWLASLEGPQGPAGTDGADGTDGTDGAQGIQGEPGTPGTDGADGAPGVVQAVAAGDGIAVDSTDPANPVVSATP